jgi:hypothetical protein
MTQNRHSANDGINRRTFVGAAGVATLATLFTSRAIAENTGGGATDMQTELLTGNGEWTYRVIADWGRLPEGTHFGGTHGGIAQDKAGNIYVSTQSETGVLVYGPDGALVKTIAGDYPEIHSLIHAEENGQEFFYATVQKGTPKENWLFIKMKTDGTVVQRITAPTEASFKSPNEWRLTAAVVGPDGSIFIANGYGDSRIFRFDKAGQYKTAYGGKGKTEGLFDCSHGLSVDPRYGQPLLLVCDRENRRLCHFDFDGKYVGTVTQHLRRPCQVSFHEDHAIVSELEGRVTILDRDNVPIAFLGDNPQKTQWANYDVQPSALAAASFSAPHGCFIDKDASIYISDWNRTGRVTKLAKVRI